jgi:hypothetical protein
MVCRSAALVLALVSVLAVRVPTVLDPTPTQLIDAGLATHFYPLDDTGYSIDVPYDGRAAKVSTTRARSRRLAMASFGTHCVNETVLVA